MSNAPHDPGAMDMTMMASGEIDRDSTAFETGVPITAEQLAETLVGMLLERQGYHRVSRLGGTQKDVDISVEQPFTGETD